MPDNDIAIADKPNKVGWHRFNFTDYVSGALTTGNAKKEWIVPFFCKIIDIVIDSAGAGVGTATTIFDINRNGTTLFTTQNNRPALRSIDTGYYKWTADGLTDRKPPDIVRLVPGDVLSYDIDQIQSTSGATRTIVNIMVDAQ